MQSSWWMQSYKKCIISCTNKKEQEKENPAVAKHKVKSVAAGFFII